MRESFKSKSSTLQQTLKTLPSSVEQRGQSVSSSDDTEDDTINLVNTSAIFYYHKWTLTFTLVPSARLLFMVGLCALSAVWWQEDQGRCDISHESEGESEGSSWTCEESNETTKEKKIYTSIKSTATCPL